MTEGIPTSREGEYDLNFEKREHRPGVDMYIFHKVAVLVDYSGTNFTQLPELLFGTFENSVEEAGILNKPHVRREGVDMKYIKACLQKVAEETGIHRYQSGLFSEDGHEKARLRLFKQYLDIEESPDGHGYIVNL
jgi:hypothetical protein